MSDSLAVGLVLLANLAWVGPLFVVLLRSQRARLKGMVKVQGIVVQTRFYGVTTPVTFDYPVRGGWLRATRLWNKGKLGFLSVPRAGQPIWILVDPDDPARTPELPGLGVDGSFAVVLGIASGMLVVALVVVALLAVVR